MSNDQIRTRSGRSGVAVTILLAATAGVVAFVVPASRNALMNLFTSDADAVDSRFILHSAESRPFRITITENGTVDSARNATLTNSVEGSTTIIALVPEGSRVNGPVVAEFGGVVEYVDAESESEAQKTLLVRGEDGKEKTYQVTMGEFTDILVEDRQQVKAGDYLAGDVVCELDSSPLVDKERQQQIDVTAARANREKAEKNVKIQETTNESLLAKAKLAEQLAELDLEKYKAKGGEYEQTVDGLMGEIKQFEEELALAQEDYEKVRDQARRGYKNLNELEASRIKVTQKQIVLDVKRGELKVLERFTKRRTESELEQLAKDTVRETLRAQLEGEAAMAQMNADYEAVQLMLAVEEEKLERLVRQIKACRLVAPQDGEVVYASAESRRSEPVVIEEGATVRERQAVIKLPDLDLMKIDARIHESRISRVTVGQPVEIEIDAVTDVTYHGILNAVSSVPVPGSWPNTDLKEYEATIEITDSKELVRKLKPGMTAQVRIIVEDRKEDVLQVPVQSILALAGRYYTYVFTKQGPERREIKVGQSNDEFMEILDGVAEGERVIMNPRTHFSREINDLEQRLLAELEESRPHVSTPELPSGGFQPGGQPEGGADAGGKKGDPVAANAGKGKAKGGPGGFTPEALMQRMDSNGDGVITKDENDMRGAFDTTDADGDGKVTKEELKKMIESRQAG